MERVSGWYKRQATKVLFLIGLVLAVMFNISTIAIVRKLAINKDLRAAMVTTASDYVKQKKICSETGNGVGSTGNGQKPNPKAPPNDSTKDNYKEEGGQNPVIDTSQTPGQKIKEIQRFYNDTIAPVNMLMGLGWGDYGRQQIMRIKLVEQSKAAESRLLRATIKSNSSRIRNTIDSLFTLVLIVNNQRVDSISLPYRNYAGALNAIETHLTEKYMKWLQPTAWEKVSYIFTHLTLTDVLGFIITALAITLGAPFWFDLLNRFVNVRAGGNNPAENAPATTVVAKTVVTQKPNINSFG